MRRCDQIHLYNGTHIRMPTIRINCINAVVLVTKGSGEFHLHSARVTLCTYVFYAVNIGLNSKYIVSDRVFSFSKHLLKCSKNSKNKRQRKNMNSLKGTLTLSMINEFCRIKKIMQKFF